MHTQVSTTQYSPERLSGQIRIGTRDVHWSDQDPVYPLTDTEPMDIQVQRNRTDFIVSRALFIRSRFEPEPMSFAVGLNEIRPTRPTQQSNVVGIYFVEIAAVPVPLHVLI